MRTHIEQLTNKCRLHINGLHTEWYESKQELYDRIDDGLGLYETLKVAELHSDSQSERLENSNSELSQKKGILRLSQSTGTYQITLL